MPNGTAWRLLLPRPYRTPEHVQPPMLRRRTGRWCTPTCSSSSRTRGASRARHRRRGLDRRAAGDACGERRNAFQDASVMNHMNRSRRDHPRCSWLAAGPASTEPAPAHAPQPRGLWGWDLPRPALSGRRRAEVPPAGILTAACKALPYGDSLRATRPSADRPGDGTQPRRQRRQASGHRRHGRVAAHPGSPKRATRRRPISRRRRSLLQPRCRTFTNAASAPWSVIRRIRALVSRI